MRIAFFSDNFYPELSGIADSILATGKELARRGHQVHFFAPRYSPKDYARLGAPIMEPEMNGRLGVTRFSSIGIPSPSGQGRLVIPTGWRVFAVRSFRPDVIHAHLPFGTGLEGLISSKIMGVPFIGTDHTPTQEFAKRYGPFRGNWKASLSLAYDAWFFNHCDFLSSPTHFIFDSLHGLRKNLPRAVVSNPIRTDIFRPSSRKKTLKRKYGLSGFTLLFTGRLAAEKNIDVLLRAAAKVRKRIPELDMVITGSGPEQEKLLRLTAELGLAERVKFTGFVPEAILPEIYNASDVFVMPSSAETQSIATMQAMLCGLPVIAAKAWGLKEYVSPKTGILVPPENVEILAKKLAYLYRRPAERKKLGGEGRKFAGQFSVSKIADRWEKIYSQVMENHDRRK